MFDLIAQISGHESESRSGVEVRGTQHLPQIPFRLRLILQHRRRELFRSVHEVSADDHDVRPPATQSVRHDVRPQRAPPSPAAQGGKEYIVLAGLASHLAQHCRFLGGSAGVGGLFLLHRNHPVQRDAPFEGHPEQQSEQRLQQGERPPLLIPSDSQDSEAEVGVHADDVGEDVVLVVVGVSPLRRETDHVPFPGIGMDFRIVHPIPLAVSDVVPEFHVLDAFGRGQGSGSQGPTDFALGSGDDQPRRNIKPTLKSDRTRDVRPIPGTARSLDITTDLVQLGRERGEVRVAEMGVLGYVSDGQRDPLPGLGKGGVGTCGGYQRAHAE